MSLPKVVVQPASEPVSMAEMKNYLKVEPDQTDDDELIDSLITSARRQAEEYTGRAFVTQTWEQYLDALPLAADPDHAYLAYTLGLSYANAAVELPRPPLQSVVSIKYYDETDAEHEWEPSNYRADTYSEPGRILLRSEGRWPSGLRVQQSILVRYVAGYGEPAEVPADIKTAIKMIVAHWYDNRESQELPPEAMRTLYPFRILGL